MRDYILLFLILISFSNIYSQQLENLGTVINSENGEICPVISPDGKTLYFRRAIYNGNDQGTSQEQWYTELDEYGDWKAPVKMESPFGNNTDNFTIFTISPDGNKIFVSNNSNDPSKSGLYFCHKTIDGWGNPEKLKIKNFKKYLDNSYWRNYNLSNSGKILLMSLSYSNDYNINGSSIYICFLEKDNTWTEPRILSKQINNEFSKSADNCVPFLASDEKTLYFSSNRSEGYGNNDIYMSKRLDDTWLRWSKPINLGSDINSSSWDAYYTIAAKGDYAYMVSWNNSYGKADIFRVKLPDYLKPDPVVLVSGKVINPDNNQPLEAEIIYYTLPNHVQAGSAYTNPTTGIYKIILPYGKQYSFIARASGYFSISGYLDLTVVRKYEELNYNIEVKPLEVGQTVRLNNIFFDFNKSSLRIESYQELERVVELMIENPTLEIELGGHTDNIGSIEYNNKLSYDRANAVLQYILSKGISKNRLSAFGYGMSKPITSNDTEENRQLNRRVEFKILRK